MSTTRLHCLFYNYNASLIIAPIIHWWLENWVHNWGTSQNLNTTAWDARQNVSRHLQKSTNVTLKVCGSYKKKTFSCTLLWHAILGKENLIGRVRFGPNSPTSISRSQIVAHEGICGRKANTYHAIIPGSPSSPPPPISSFPSLPSTHQPLYAARQ